MNEIYHHALKLLRRKDYTQKQLLEKLEEKFGDVPDDITQQLLAKRFLNDQRYADNFVARHSDCHPDWVREALRGSRRRSGNHRTRGCFLRLALASGSSQG